MNPRYRRLLIPGLLLVLLVIVLISSLARRAEGAESAPHVVSRMTDPRIGESSGLVLSRAHRDLAYTINDSGNAPIVYAIKVSTGQVVGTTTVGGGTLVDTEAISIDSHGTLWIADTGDNLSARHDIALYSLPEPGTGVHSVTAKRYPLSYDIGPTDAETLLINPVTDAKYLVTKELFAGRVIQLPASLREGVTTKLKASGVDVLGFATDGTFSLDGRYAIVRGYFSMTVYNAKTWKVVSEQSLPSEKQGESIAMERSGRSVLIGSEGLDSAILRVSVSLPASAQVPPPVDRAASDTRHTIAPLLYVVGAVVAAGVLGAGVAVHVKRSR
jgi:hypothetical protein